MLRIKYLLGFFLLILTTEGIAQNERTDSFDIIIGISAENSKETVAELRSIASVPNGLSFLGYCKSQVCVIMVASSNNFPNREEVIKFLQTRLGKSILGYKDYSITDFYKTCSFETESEYHYFKTTYK